MKRHQFKRVLFRGLALVLMFISCSVAAEDPIWEIRLRLNGGDHARFDDLLREVLGNHHHNLAGIGKNAVVRLAGFDNPATPGEDWVAEVDGLDNLNQVIENLTKGVNPDEDGKFRIRADGMDFVTWREGATGLRFAGPVSNADSDVRSRVTLGDQVWLAGWVNLKRLPRKDIESITLKLPENLMFSLSGGDDTVKLGIQAGMAHPRHATAAKRLLGDLAKELAAEFPRNAPVLEVKSDGRSLTATLEFDPAMLDKWIREASAELKSE